TPVTRTAGSRWTDAEWVTNVGATVMSAAATLTVNAAAVAPTITTAPANQTVTAGQTASFTVVAGGTAPLSYQWQKNGANIAGATERKSSRAGKKRGDRGSTFAEEMTK